MVFSILLKTFLKNSFQKQESNNPLWPFLFTFLKPVFCFKKQGKHTFGSFSFFF